MKTKKTLLTLAAIAIVALASATELPKMNVQPINSDQVVVSILNGKVANFELSIYSDNGEIVYFKQSEKPVSSYQKLFDLSNLENGKYKLNVKVGGVIEETDFTKTTNKIYLADTQTDYEPYFDFNGKELKFSYLNRKGENMKLKILNNGDLVYETKLGKGFPITYGYDLSKLETGNYEVILSSYNKDFVYSFQK